MTDLAARNGPRFSSNDEEGERDENSDTIPLLDGNNAGKIARRPAGTRCCPGDAERKSLLHRPLSLVVSWHDAVGVYGPGRRCGGGRSQTRKVGPKKPPYGPAHAQSSALVRLAPMSPATSSRLVRL